MFLDVSKFWDIINLTVPSVSFEQKTLKIPGAPT